jgi:hypothetical protein
MKNKTLAIKVTAILTLVISVILSMFVLYTPGPEKEHDGFSSERALTYIKEISKKPHSVFDLDAHEEVRLYIKDTLTGFLGSENVKEFSYPISYSDFVGLIDIPNPNGEVRNILGVIPGKSETAIMLVGHYDSVPESFGAMDDGYALGTMLEIADLFKDQQLDNTIYFLFTDSEEMGLDGATAAVSNEKDLMSKVGFVINIEARGVNGAAFMFETSQNNKKVIDFYRKANFPVSYSLATAIYQVMPNDTDFTLFRKAGINGVNFAAIGGIDHYHTPLDNYDEISPSTLQHYGEQIFPLVDTFARNSEYSDVHYFDAEEGSVFFTLLPNVFISYPETVAKILHVAALILLIVVTVVMLQKRQAQFRKTIGNTLIFIATFVLSVLLSVGLALLVANIGDVEYYPTYVVVPGSDWATLIFMLVVTVAAYAIYASCAKSIEKQRTFLLYGIAIQLLIALISGFLLPGVSFLFFIPAFLGTLSLFVSMKENTVVKGLIYGLTILISALFIVPVIYTFFQALTIGCLPVLVIILLIHLTILVPVIRLFWGAGSSSDKKDSVLPQKS